MTPAPEVRQLPGKLLVAYSRAAAHVPTTLDYLQSFSRYWPGDVYYLNVTHGSDPQIDLNEFDVVFHNYCARLSYRDYISQDYVRAMQRFRGLKIAAVQDEYEFTDQIREHLRRLGFHVVLTCVPQSHVQRIYAKEQFPGVEFITELTGHVPERVPSGAGATPLAMRPVLIGYRGRDIGARFGRLAREKIEIGRRMREICEARGLAHDIEWAEDKRIYGAGWFQFLGSCRAILGSESGSNIFDPDGSLVKRYEAMKAELGGSVPYAAFAGITDPLEDHVPMGQVSPRVFEAAATRTALVLFGGTYSGILSAGQHYIELAKDFSNADAVLNQLGNVEALEAMTERAYQHLVASGRFSHAAFVNRIEQAVLRKQAELNMSPPRIASWPADRWAKAGEANADDGFGEFPTPLPGGREQLDRRITLQLSGRSGRTQTVVDRGNSEFWDMLCGSGMATELGIEDFSCESLAKFDAWYLGYYPYLDRHIPFETVNGAKVLEVGLGYGTVGQRLAQRGAVYTGLDIAQRPVALVQERLRMNALPGTAAVGSILTAPFRDHSFDVVVAIGCYHHTGNLQRAIDESWRILRPGGELCFMVYNSYSYRQWHAHPRRTARRLALELLGRPLAHQGEDTEKAQYDTDAKGNVPPHTEFASTRSLHRMCARFRSFSSTLENWSTDLNRVPREMAVNRRRTKWLGLDVYVRAMK